MYEVLIRLRQRQFLIYVWSDIQTTRPLLFPDTIVPAKEETKAGSSGKKGHEGFD
jgi:hypothetical protein